MITTNEKLTEFKNNTKADEELSQVKSYIQNGWPKYYKDVHHKAKPYFHFRNDLFTANDLIFRNQQIVIPQIQRQDILAQIHAAHQGIMSCLKKARSSIYWPGMSTQIKELVLGCTQCQQYSRSNSKEPVISHEIPELPWQKIGVDFMEVQKKNYFVAVDYHSKFIELIPMIKKDCPSVLNALSKIIATHGFPSQIISDGGPPFNSSSFVSRLNKWNIEHTTSSPGYPKSNGMIERHIQTIKSMLLKSKENHMFVKLEYNSTPKEAFQSPAELLMGRRLRTLLPTTDDALKPNFNRKNILQSIAAKKKEIQKKNMKMKSLPKLQEGEEVFMQNDIRKWIPGKILDAATQPRSYWIRADNGTTYRRNRIHLKPAKLKPSLAVIKNSPFPEYGNRLQVIMNSSKEDPPSTAKKYNLRQNRAAPDRYGIS